MSLVLGESNTLWLDTEERLGAGKFGVVTVGYDVADVHRRVALKRLVPQAQNAQRRPSSGKREIDALARMAALRHANILRLIDVADTTLGSESDSAVTLVLELCIGGDLLKRIESRGRLPEDEARTVFRQIVSGVETTHSAGLVHRDLKLENFLLDSQGGVKIADWGFACEWQRGRRLSEHCGSLLYAAPEVLGGKRYDGPEVDIWALGVVLFAMLTAHFPFHGDTDECVALAISLGRFTLPQYLSSDVCNLIQVMLNRDPSCRPSATQLLKHPWLINCNNLNDINSAPPAPRCRGRPVGSSLASIPEVDEDTMPHEAERLRTPAAVCASSSRSPSSSSSSSLSTSSSHSSNSFRASRPASSLAESRQVQTRPSLVKRLREWFRWSHSGSKQ